MMGIKSASWPRGALGDPELRRDRPAGHLGRRPASPAPRRRRAHTLLPARPVPHHVPPLSRAFYARPAEQVARDLLGHEVVSDVTGERVRARIVETEAYIGPTDPGSHAKRGRHTQAGALWEEPGHAYVYVCYGVHQMLNAVAHAPGEVGAVLIRAAEVMEGHATARARRPGVADRALARGPGNLARVLGVTREEHEAHPLDEPPLSFAQGRPVPDEGVAVTGRIGLTQGGDLPLRFVECASPAVSGPRLAVLGGRMQKR